MRRSRCLARFVPVPPGTLGLPLRGRNRDESCLAPHGFTLIELLAVLAIIAILLVVLVPRLSKAGEIAEERFTKAYLTQLDTALAEYEQQMGDYPPSKMLEEWTGFAPGNTTNLGAEVLVLSLWSPKWGGTTLAEDRFVNTDEDDAKKPLAKFPKAALLELRDEWGNPIAYFHRRDYGRSDTYVTQDPSTGEEIESIAVAHKNEVTGSYFNPNRFQLISAGLDGQFGTGDDDIGNWEKPK